MASGGSPMHFRSQQWSNHPTESDLEPMNTRRTKRSVPGDVSRSWHAGCSSMEQSLTQSRDLTQPAHHYAFATLFRTSTLPLLPSELVPGFTRSATADILNVRDRFAGSSAPNKMRTGVNGTGRIKVILCVQRLFSHPSTIPGWAHPASGPAHSIPFPNQQPEQGHVPTSISPCIGVDLSRAQITLTDPNPIRRRGGNFPVPKQFTFDAVLTREVPMTDLCLLALTGAIQAVLRGQDGCILTIGHKRTGKTYSMLGSDRSTDGIGIIPCAIAWLFELLNRQKDLKGIRFSVRVSAVEIYGTEERFQDLLSDATSSNGDEVGPESYPPSHYLTPPNTKTINGDPLSHSDGNSVAARTVAALTKRNELRASSAEKAAWLLDQALAHRAHVREGNQSGGLSHMLFTLHVYQCRVEQNEHGTSISGGRTRLHFLDLGCGRYTHHTSSANSTSLDLRKQSRSRSARSRESRTLGQPQESARGTEPEINTGMQTPRCLSLSAMANVLLALLTGQRHLPFRDSALTYVLREAVSGNQIQPCILAHVASSTQHYTETLQVVQLAAKLSRLRRRRVGVPGSGIHQVEPYASSPSETTSFDDTAASSVESGSQSPGRRERIYRRRYKGPRMGRSSYARSVSSLSSDLDFTSGSEQSCDTVIYLGGANQNSPQHQLSRNWSNRDHRSGRRLGPRGTADGSVDIQNDVPGTKMSSECINNRGDRLPESEVHSSEFPMNPGPSPIHTHLSVGPVKRMMPRTNATVWPRSMSFRKAKACLDTNTETWVDGPKAMIAVCNSKVEANVPDQAHQNEPGSLVPVGNESDSKINHEENITTDSSNVIEESGKENMRSSQLQGAIPPDKKKFTTETSELPGDVLSFLEDCSTLEHGNNTWDLLNYRLLSLPNPEKLNSQTSGSMFTSDPLESLCQSVSSSSTLERDAHLLPRALSDISERTEETEGLTDCATMPKKQIANSNFTSHIHQAPMRTQCLRSELNESGHFAYATETSLKLMELRKQIQSAACTSKEETRGICASFCADHSSHGSISSPPPTSRVDLSNEGKSTQTGHGIITPNNHVQINRGPSPNSRPLRGTPADPLPSKQTMKTVETSHLKREKTEEYSVTDSRTCTNTHSIPSKEIQTKYGLDDCAEEKLPGSKHPASYRSNTHASGNNSLLRVAAWVNSIGIATGTEDLIADNRSTVPRLYSLSLSPGNIERDDSMTKRSIIDPTDINTSPSSHLTCANGTSAFMRTFHSPLSDRIMTRGSSVTSASPTRHTTSPSLGTFHRPSFPTSSLSTQSDLERNSPVIWYNSAGRYFSFEPSPIQIRNRSHTLNPIQSTSPRHQSLSLGHDSGPPNGQYPTASPTSTRPIPLAMSSMSPEQVNSLRMNKLAENRFRAPLHATPVHVQCELRMPCPSSGFTESSQLPVMCSNENETQKEKRKPRLRFLTLPLFRGLRIRNRDPKKSKKGKSDWATTQEGEHKSHPPIVSSIPVYPSDQTAYPQSNWPDGTPSTGTTVTRNVTQLETFQTNLNHMGEAHSNPVEQPHLVLGTIANPYTPSPTRNGDNIFWMPIVQHPHPEMNGPSKEIATEFRQNIKLPKRIDSSKSPWHGRRSERESLPEDLLSSPLNTIHYTGGLLNSAVYRSGRRSVTGGAASSGYESMRFGASDLSSLSHPDSASDCSGLMSNKLASCSSSTNEATRCVLCTAEGAGHARRNHNGSSANLLTTVGRMHGSTGSIGRTSSQGGHTRFVQTSQQAGATQPINSPKNF